MNNYLQRFQLSDKIAFIVGATGLIGQETSKALAQAGAFVVLLDIDQKKGKSLEREIRQDGGCAQFMYFDITNIKKIEKELVSLTQRFEGLDIWVNCAYPRTYDWNQSDPLKVNLDSLRKNIDSQLTATLWSSRVVALLMKKERVKGSIIHFGSIYGVQGNDFTVYEGTTIKGPMAYSAIKGGIVNFSRYLAAYFGPDGIRVNCVCPGGVFDQQEARFVKNYEKKVPLKRMAQPEEIASVVLFLAGDASSYMTGTTVMVDGGWTIV